MNKSQALDKFWNSFGIPAYDENTIPDNPGERYITYSVSTGRIEDVINLTGKIWEKNTTSWKFVEDKSSEIAYELATMDPPTISIDNGRLYLTMGTPFSQRLSDPDSMARGVYINIQAEFLTAY